MIDQHRTKCFQPFGHFVDPLGNGLARVSAGAGKGGFALVHKRAHGGGLCFHALARGIAGLCRTAEGAIDGGCHRLGRLDQTCAGCLADAFNPRQMGRQLLCCTAGNFVCFTSAGDER